jgi:proteasome lid subunit RPN8/RPN11
MAITRAFRRLTRRLVAREARLRFTNALWDAMLAELGRRGRGTRESGAFLLAARDGDLRTIDCVVYLDDLDPNCLTGAIAFDGAHYGKLWDICDQRDLKVVADVHTHPGPAVAQSGIDKDNPMIARVGHIAIIVPELATRPVSPHEIGVHEYLGDDGWRSSFGEDAADLVYVGGFA